MFPPLLCGGLCHPTSVQMGNVGWRANGMPPHPFRPSLLLSQTARCEHRTPAPVYGALFAPQQGAKYRCVAPLHLCLAHAHMQVSIQMGEGAGGGMASPFPVFVL
jgi:hypothetical protein